VLACALGLRRPRGRRGHVRVAHTERLRELAAYRRVVGRRRLGLVLSLMPLAAAIALCAQIAARPVVVETHRSHLDNRDIVLCLDVSGSMADENLAIIRTFRRLVAGMQGERIGLVVFNTFPRPVFPLTDDYDLIRTQLEVAEGDLDEHRLTSGRLADLARGVTHAGLGQSLVGDGLMGCLDLFTADVQVAELRQGASEQVRRSRVVILATDNQQLNARGHQLFTVSDAALQAEAYDAAVVVLAADSRSAAAQLELAQVAERTGGAVYPAGAGEDAVREITRIVQELESTTIEGPAVTARFDVPGREVGALLLVMGLLCGFWWVMRP